MNAEYDMTLVFASFIIAVCGSYAALMLAGNVTDLKRSGARLWLLFAAVSLGGVGIWSMHFIGMLAYKTPMPVSYDMNLTIGSMLISVALTAVGFSMVMGREKVDMARLLGAGATMGLGVAAMHYMGMQAMIMSGEMHHNYTIVAISVAIAIVASSAALWIAVNMRLGWQKLISAFVMGVAVCGMHYTAMTGLSFTHSSVAVVAPVSGVDHSMLAIYVMLAAGIIFITALGALMFQGVHDTSKA